MSTTPAYTGHDPDGGPGDRRAMKVCQLCGDVYKDHVDFCFNDGEILVASAVAASPSSVEAELDPPMPRRVQGGQQSMPTVGAPAERTWPEAVPVPRPQPTPVSNPEVSVAMAQSGRMSAAPAVNLSTDTTLPPDTILPPLGEPVPSANRDKPTIEPQIGEPNPVAEPVRVPVEVITTIPPAILPPSSVQPARPAGSGGAVLPSAVPTPVTPEPREALRVAPIIDRPLGAQSEAETPRPAAPARTPPPARPVNALPAQVRIGGGAAIAVDAIGERSNWLMIGAVFAVGVLFSVMGAGAVLAGMLYTGAPWGQVAVEEPVADPERPIQVLTPEPPSTPSPVEEPAPGTDGVEVEPASPASTQPDQAMPTKQPVPSPQPVAAPSAPTAPSKPILHKVRFEAQGDYTVRESSATKPFADVHGASLAEGRYALVYEQPGSAPIRHDCVVPDPKLPPGSETDCSTHQVFQPATPPPAPPPPKAAETVRAAVSADGLGTVSLRVDGVDLGSPPLLIKSITVGPHPCVIITTYGTFDRSCVVSRVGAEGSAVGVLNLAELVPAPPAAP